MMWHKEGMRLTATALAVVHTGGLKQTQEIFLILLVMNAEHLRDITDTREYYAPLPGTFPSVNQRLRIKKYIYTGQRLNSKGGQMNVKAAGNLSEVTFC